MFNPDGTINVYSNNSSNLDTAIGTWSRSGLVVTGDYTYTNGSEFSTKGNLSISDNDVLYNGTWYKNHGAVNENKGNVFELELE